MSLDNIQTIPKTGEGGHVFTIVDADLEDAKKTMKYVAGVLDKTLRITIYSMLPLPNEDEFKEKEERDKCIEKATNKTNIVLEICREFLIEAGFHEDNIGVKLDVKDCFQISDCLNKAREEEDVSMVIIGRRQKPRKQEALGKCVAFRFARLVLNSLYDTYNGVVQNKEEDECPVFIVKLDGSFEELSKCDNVWL